MYIDYAKWKLFADSLIQRVMRSGKNYSSVYGVPRGGTPLAVYVADKLKIPVIGTLPVTETCLIVDDLIDSGRTRERFSTFDFESLIDKKIDGLDGEWIEFWYEVGEKPIEDNIVRILQYIGEDPKREGLKETPERIIASYAELFKGYKEEPKDVIKTFDCADYDQIILAKDIELYSFCEHHMLPFFGKCHIAYIPNGRVVGVSKLARLMDVFARRLQIQERLTQQIGQALQDALQPRGVAVIIEAQHFCMLCRGVQKQDSKMVTSFVSGLFMDEPKAKAELMMLIKN